MKKNYIFAAIAIALLTGCSNEDEPQTGTEGEVALSVASASVQAMTTKGAYDTGGILTTDGNIGVSVISGTGYSTVNDYNVQYSYDNIESEWKPAGASIYLNNNAATLLAIAPFTSGVDYLAASLTAQIYDEAKDLCVSRGPVTAVNSVPAVDFIMDHVYARLSFTINKDVTYSGTGAITNIAIENADAIFATAAADLTVIPDPAITFGTAGPVQYNPAITEMTTGIPVPSSMLMIPSATANFLTATTVRFTVDGIDLTASLPVAAPAAGGINELIRGTNYLINVSIKGTALIVNSVTVTNWIPETVANDVVPVPSPV